MSTANTVVDISSPIQTQLCVVHNNDDTGWCPKSGKVVKDDKKVRPIRKHEYNSTWIQFQTNANGALAFIGNCLCGLDRVMRFVKDHLHCIFLSLNKHTRNVYVTSPGKISADAHAQAPRTKQVVEEQHIKQNMGFEIFLIKYSSFMLIPGLCISNAFFFIVWASCSCPLLGRTRSRGHKWRNRGAAWAYAPTSKFRILPRYTKFK